MLHEPGRRKKREKRERASDRTPHTIALVQKAHIFSDYFWFQRHKKKIYSVSGDTLYFQIDRICFRRLGIY